MKQKGISIWEQNVEYIVLGAAVLFFLVFTVLQFLGGSGEASEIDGKLRDKANDLVRRLDRDAPSPIEIPEPEPVLDEFLAQLDTPVSPGRIVQAPWGGQRLAGDVRPTGGDSIFVEPDVAAPDPIVVAQYFDMIADEAIQAHPELAARFEAKPYDVMWTTVAGLLPMEQIHAAFTRPGPNGEEPIPSQWFFPRISILDVRIEREELVDGLWTNRMTIDPLPGAFTFRERISGPVSATERYDIASQLRKEGVQRLIIQPDFYTTVQGNFVPPDPSTLVDEGEEMLTEEEKELRKEEGRLRSLIRARDRAVQKLKERVGVDFDPVAAVAEEEQAEHDGGGTGGAGGGSGGKPPPGPGGAGGGGRAPPGPGTGGGGGIGGGGKAPPGPGSGSGGGGVGGSPGSGKEDRGASGGRADREIDPTRAIERLKRQAMSRQRAINRLTERIEQMRIALGLVAPGEEEAAMGDPMDAKEVLVWGHDIDIEPGKTYRYRITVDLFNPFHGRKLDLVDEQKHLAESITLSSASSEWSDPYTVIPWRKVFITSATSAEGDLGLGRANAEVYFFSHGRWWMEDFPVEPGDRVGSMKTFRRLADPDAPDELDFGTGWFVLDIIGDPTANKQAVDRGWAASVLLQRIDDPSVVKLCDPAAMFDSAERERLRSEVELAEDQLASTQ
jgi:hypothetical protein